MVILKDDQKKIVDFLEKQKREDTPIENGSIGIVTALIQTGMLDYMLAEESTEDFIELI